MAKQSLSDPSELFHYQLKSAMTMENDSLAALGELRTAAKSTDIKKMLKHHADETKEQLENLKRVFELIDRDAATAPSPSTKGISKQAESLLEKSAPKLRDQVVLASALGNEHFEISAYEGLIIPAEALGLSDAVALLQANLDQEVHTSEELRTRLTELVHA